MEERNSHLEVKPRFSLKRFLFGNINRKFFFIFGIIFILILLLGSMIMFFQNKVLNEQFFNSIEETGEDFIDIQEESVRTLSAALEVVLQDPGLKEIYLEKDREKLFNYGQPLFKNLKDNYNITHFYFILPDGHNFVRIHNKEKYGDLIERATFLETQKTKKVSSGIELGKTAYALRVVMPYYKGNELIGYVELGQEIEEFLKIMKKGKPNEFLLVVEKESLNEEDWRSSREVKGLRDNWDDLGEHVTIESTTEEIFSCFSDKNVNLLEKNVLFLETSKIEDKTFACGGFSLIDASNEKSGAIFSLIDVSEEKKLMSNIRIMILSSLLLIVLVFIGIGFYVSRKVSSPLSKLSLATEEIKKKNFKARVNIDTGDELEALGKNFNETAEVLENLDAERKQIDKAKTEFLSITSHELRSPMTPMRAQLQMLDGEYFGKLTPKQKEAIGIVLRNTERLDNIIVDFLEISRIEAARLKFKFAKTDLNKTINLLIKEMGGFMPEKRIEIINNVKKLPIIEVDPDRVSQVLRNLMNNAIKFTPKNGKIEVGGRAEGKFILFSVKDSGVGIAKKDQERLFEPFYQAENMYQHTSGGTGLGLAIVKGIVESQDGQIWLESKVGKGTVFQFTIPLKPVRIIRAIKILFSEHENVEKEIKHIFKEVLGPMGDQEFEHLKRTRGTTKKDLEIYVNSLVLKGILDLTKGEEFKNKIFLKLSGDSVKVGSAALKKSGLISGQSARVNVQDVINKKFVEKSIREKIKKVYIEMLGARGENYFERLSGLDSKIIFPQIDLLVAKSILTEQKSEEFKNKIKLILRE